MRTTILASLVLLLSVGAPFSVHAQSSAPYSFQQLDQSQCSTYTLGIKSGTGCALGKMCVMVGSGAYTGNQAMPTCMDIQGATKPNYNYSSDCNAACGHTCTTNATEYTTTFYCGPAPATQASTPPSGTQFDTPANTSGQVLDTPPNTGNTGQTVTLVNPLGDNTCSANGTCLFSFLSNIMKFVVQIGSIIVILMLVFVGYKFVAAQGSDSKLSEAKQMLLWTIVGALILLGAQAIALGIQSTVSALGG